MQERSTGAIVGTYRIQMGDVAGQNFGYYSEQEFCFAPFEAMRSQILELGRACIHRDHRSSEVLHLLWRGLARYSLLNGGRYMMGCCSLPSLDTDLAYAIYDSLAPWMTEPALQTVATAAFRMPPRNAADPRRPRPQAAARLPHHRRQDLQRARHRPRVQDHRLPHHPRPAKPPPARRRSLPGGLLTPRMQRPLLQLRSHLRSVQRSLWAFALLLAANLDFRLRRPRSGAEGAIRIQLWCRRILAALGLSIHITGTLPEAGAVVANHLSYLDILLFSAIRPFVMVAKREVRSWPLLGWLTAQAGTVYVQRGGHPSTYPAVNQAMAEAYRTGLPVLFFPEGTTTNGSEVLPFRRGLFHSVLNNGVPLRTATLRYTLDEDLAAENGNATVADHVCWWGDAYLGPHLFRCLGLRGLRAEIHFDDAVIEGRDRFALSENARAAITARYAAQDPAAQTAPTCETQLA